MPEPRLIYLSIPGLRRKDLPSLSSLGSLSASPDVVPLQGSFPAVTWPAQANVLCGCTAGSHGVVSNGFYWRDERRVEMWTAWNRVIQQPQLWDRLRDSGRGIRTAAWFPMLSKGCQADLVCMPAPIHKPDGSEELWCHTRPQEFYGELLQSLGHFPLHHFWGPLAGIQSSRWIVESAIAAHRRFSPHFWYIYLPHLDYAAQKSGPDSEAAQAAVRELDTVLARLVEGIRSCPDSEQIAWVVASEYVISPVQHVSFPNRILREGGWLQVADQGDGETLDLERSAAWTLVDHQFSNVFVRDRDPATIAAIADRFRSVEGIEHVWDHAEQARQGIAHERGGDLVLVSRPDSWQAYYWWNDDARAPGFARTVDIHRKPGYDPVELFFDPATRSIPLNASLVKGSHGAIHPAAQAESVLWSTSLKRPPRGPVKDIEVSRIVLDHFGV